MQPNVVFEAGTSDTKHNSVAEKRKFEEVIAGPELGSFGRISFTHAPNYVHSASHTPREQSSHLTCNCMQSKVKSIGSPSMLMHGSGQLKGIMPSFSVQSLEGSKTRTSPALKCGIQERRPVLNLNDSLQHIHQQPDIESCRQWQCHSEPY